MGSQNNRLVGVEDKYSWFIICQLFTPTKGGIMPSELPGRSMRTMRKRAPRSMVSPSRSVAEGISDAGILSAELPGDTWLAVEDVYDTAGERPLS